MKFARITVGGQSFRVDLPEYIRRRADNPEIANRVICSECGKPVHTYNEKGALGFRVVNKEVVQHPKKHRHPLPGFHHYDHNAGNDCPLSFADDPRLKGIREHNEFDALEKERNVQALGQAGVKEAIAEVHRYFMQRLTGVKELTAEDQKQFDKIQNRLAPMVGLAEHKWILGYMAPVLVGSRQRVLGNRSVRLEYKSVGHQDLPVTSLDGQARVLRVPKYIALCFSRKDGKEPKALMRENKPIMFEVSRDFAAGIVRTARASLHAPHLQRGISVKKSEGGQAVDSMNGPRLPVEGGALSLGKKTKRRLKKAVIAATATGQLNLKL